MPDKQNPTRSASYFEVLFENMVEAVVVYDRDGRVVDFNTGALRLLGSDEASLRAHRLGDPLKGSVFRADGSLYADDELPAYRVLRTGERVEKELLGVPGREAGRLTWIQLSAIPIFADGETRPIQVMCTMRDVTESFESEERIRASESQFKSFFEHSPVSTILVDESRRYVRANPAFQKLMGYSEEELRDFTILELTHPDDLEKTRHAAVNCWADPNFVLERFLKRNITKDGRVVWLHVSSKQIPVDPGRPRYLLSVLEDVTEAVESEKTLKMLETLLQTTPDLVGCADANGRVLFRNRAWMERRSTSGHAATFVTSEGVPPWAQRIVLEEGMPTARERGIWQGQTAIIGKNGDEIPVSQVMVCHKDEEGRPVFYGTILRDMSEIRKLHFELMHASKLVSLGEMAAGVAHEINNPLTIIHGKAILMRTRLGSGRFDPVSFDFDLERIEATALRIAKIVKNLKAFSRSAEGESVATISVRQLIEDALELCSARFRSESIRLEVQPVPEVDLSCRPTQITQVVMNLLNNAHDAVEGLAERWIDLKVEASSSEVRLIVTDSGRGIPEKITERMMEPFFTTKPVGKGVGLGLSISRSVAEDHGGSLQYQAGERTRFVLTLPKAGPGTRRSPVR